MNLFQRHQFVEQRQFFHNLALFDRVLGDAPHSHARIGWRAIDAMPLMGADQTPPHRSTITSCVIADPIEMINRELAIGEHRNHRNHPVGVLGVAVELAPSRCVPHKRFRVDFIHAIEHPPIPNLVHVATDEIFDVEPLACFRR